MTQARATQISLDDTPYYHCVARCVRRAFLCGQDSVTGRDYDHRRQWIVDKLKSLATVFALDICAYAVMSNHYHVVLHINTDKAKQWTDAEVIERWTTLFSGGVLIQRYLKGEANSDAERLKVAEIVADWRERLTSISWFMRCLNEAIARQANREDHCKGRFWEGRFRSQALLDDTAVLACMMYVDLNPIRAGIADCPENSDYTSIQQRLQHYAQTLQKPGRKATFRATPPQPQPDTSATAQPLDLFPFVGGEHQDTPSGVYFALEDYLELLDWTGRVIREDKRGAIPAHIKPLLHRLGVNPLEWQDNIQHFGRRYRLAAGAMDKLRVLSERLGRAWLHGIGTSRQLYQPATVY